MTEVSNKVKLNSMHRQKSADGAGKLIYKELSRKLKKTSKEHVGFEIDGKLPVWESIRKKRLLLRYDIRSIINFSNHTRKVEKREEGIKFFKHKYTVKQQLIFWRVLVKLMAAKLVENRCMLILPLVGKLRLSKTDKKGTYYDEKEGKCKVHLNLHTLRKFISIKFVRDYTLDAATCTYKKSGFIRYSIYSFYKKREPIYESILQKIKTKYGLH